MAATAHVPGETPVPAWRATGLLFENCTCQLVCPGHMHFSQACTHERCCGYWAVGVDEGRFGDVVLDGARAVVAFDAPRHMIEGNWTEVVILDEASPPEQRAAMEAILTGRAGGAWALLAKFVGRWLDTRVMPIAVSEDGTSERARIPGLPDAVISDIKGRDRSRPVTFDNIFNQIHGPTQVLALGGTQCDDGVIRIATRRPTVCTRDSSGRSADATRDARPGAAGRRGGRGGGRLVRLARASRLAVPHAHGADPTAFALAVVMWLAMIVAMMTPTVLLAGRLRAAGRAG